MCKHMSITIEMQALYYNVARVNGVRVWPLLNLLEHFIHLFVIYIPSTVVEKAMKENVKIQSKQAHFITISCMHIQYTRIRFEFRVIDCWTLQTCKKTNCNTAKIALNNAVMCFFKPLHIKSSHLLFVICCCCTKVQLFNHYIVTQYLYAYMYKW